MSVLPLDLYNSALTSHAGPEGCRCDEWQLRYADGASLPLALGRWCNQPADADLELLSRCTDPTLDVGCGPGRLVATLAAAGRPALGIDVATSAVRLTRMAGAEALRRSVFSPLPDEGQWGSVLLADGNIGIGGDPVALLRRCRELIAVDGNVLVELDPPGSRSSSSRVRLEARHNRSSWFAWAHVAVDGIESVALDSQLQVVDNWAADERWFACLAR